MESQKKRKIINEASYCKQKRSRSEAKNSVDKIWKEDAVFQEAEFLNTENVRAGMVLLGCITAIKPTFLTLSLPGYLYGTVPLNNISSAFTKSLTEHAANSELDEPSLMYLFKIGMVFPCKIMQISRDLSKKETLLFLSINPVDTNADLRPSSLYAKMVLYVSICSIEDHGYIVDVGTKNIRGFLSKQNFENKNCELKIGEIIPTLVKQISYSPETMANVMLSPLDFNQDFPKISVESIKLSSILPGARIQCNVVEIKHPFIYMEYSSLDVCASVLSLGLTYKAITVGSKVSGTVLYVHSVTRVIYLMLNTKPSPELFAEYFNLRMYSCVENLKYQCSFEKMGYYRINKGTCGFVPVRNLPQKDTSNVSRENYTVPKARILCFHYMDNLVELSTKPSVVEEEVVFLEDVEIGDVYNAVVTNHVKDRMFVKICRGLYGFVRKIHLSDSYLAKFNSLPAVGEEVECRVLSTDGKGKLNLTCKYDLIKLPGHQILSSYENVQVGQFYKGIIVQKTTEYILVLFFNDIKGIVPSAHIPKGYLFFEGQTVLCEVLCCNSLQKKLKLSLDFEERWPLEAIDDFDDFDDFSSNFSEKSCDSNNSKVNEEIHSQKICKRSVNTKNTCPITDNDRNISLPDESRDAIHNAEYNSGTALKAIIRSIKGSQININLNKTEGRVHITALGCKSEGVYPLREFSINQKIKVYIIGEFMKQKNNYLKITHKQHEVYKECSLNPSPILLSQELNLGESIIGFVKEVHDVSVVLWLTPTRTGVLEYLHFSGDLKVIKKLSHHLKIGLSMEVSILDNSKPVIALTRLDKNLPRPGENIIGLVQLSDSVGGLILKLPHGYHGIIDITDLTDVYIPIHSYYKYRELQFLLCHILEVNHQTKYCQLSLRKSRVYGKKMTPSTRFCPEVTRSNIKEGDVVKGFIKSVSDSDINIVLGRNLQGILKINNSTSVDYKQYKFIKNIHYCVGNIIEVIVRKKFKGGKPCILDLANCTVVKSNKCNWLRITQDFSWED